MVGSTNKSRRKLVAGNWKMNGLRHGGEALVRDLLERVKAQSPLCEVLICPPATLIMPLGEILTGSSIALGGQDCHAQQAGAHTGDISAAMLKDLGCTSVIVGHSERRSNHLETSVQVHAKAKAALAAGLTPIVCVGETEEERASGRALSVVTSQIARSIPETTDTFIVAYEPVWAIGSGRVPTCEEIVEVHATIRACLLEQIRDGDQIRILYGGSVKASNAKELMALDGVDGALVGGASLVAEEFWNIILAAA